LDNGRESDPAISHEIKNKNYFLFLSARKIMTYIAKEVLANIRAISRGNTEGASVIQYY